MKALIKDGVVQNLSDTEYPPFDGMEWVDCPDDCQPAWAYIDGLFLAPVISEPVLSKQEQLDQFNNRIQNFIDAKAIEKGYQFGFACATYISSSNTQWAAEAQTFISWRDNVWSLTFEAIEPFELGTGELPNVDDFISSLPEIVWP